MMQLNLHRNLHIRFLEKSKLISLFINILHDYINLGQNDVSRNSVKSAILTYLYLFESEYIIFWTTEYLKLFQKKGLA
jgi:hypothetical protein